MHLVSSSESGKATFDELKLSQETLAALDRADYEHPSPIQAGLIPVALQGADVIGQARTGTGKTASFAIPILEQLKPRKEVRGVQALILVPTRELAVQVREEIDKLAFGRQVTCLAIYGGKPVRGQIEKLRRNPQIVVGTPGRLLDHMGRRTLLLENISMLVLDEADRMLDIGFRPDIEKILRRCPTARQTMLLSATIPPPVERLARNYMRDPQKLNFSPKDITVDTIDQYYFTVDGRRKFELLVRVLKRDQPKQAIVFCRTKKGTDRIYRRLSKSTKLVACIHGDMDQNARDRAMASFRKGKARILVATDVVGRGIDVTSISHIINFDIPQFCDDYVHRVGRAGRMGREGIAYTFVTPEEGNELTRIEMRINVQLKRDEMDRFDAVEELDPSSNKVQESSPAESSPAEPAPPTPPDSLRRGRGPRRHRRAL
ncbi:MAG: DEAD/DEAH box helicase [Planctomycetaceae bacterium]|nr:DEAD/DEAH box helicase [Planctomycetaceae bacterium]MBP62156.1 DEAD/DEAH box helicase [Planctomycetaceae bacterium]